MFFLLERLGQKVSYSQRESGGVSEKERHRGREKEVCGKERTSSSLLSPKNPTVS